MRLMALIKMTKHDPIPNSIQIKQAQRTKQQCSGKIRKNNRVYQLERKKFKKLVMPAISERQDQDEQSAIEIDQSAPMPNILLVDKSYSPL